VAWAEGTVNGVQQSRGAEQMLYIGIYLNDWKKKRQFSQKWEESMILFKNPNYM